MGNTHRNKEFQSVTPFPNENHAANNKRKISRKSHKTAPQPTIEILPPTVDSDDGNFGLDRSADEKMTMNVKSILDRVPSAKDEKLMDSGTSSKASGDQSAIVRTEIDFRYTEGQSRRGLMADCEFVCSEILDYLFVGGSKVATSWETISQHGITRVVNCSSSVVGNCFVDKPDMKYLTLNMVDGRQDDVSWFVCEVIHFIFDGRLAGEKTLVHCEKGISRSCSFVIAFVMWCTGAKWKEAFDFVKQRRKVCAPNTAFTCNLIEMDEILSGDAKTSPLLFRCSSHLPHDSATPVLKLCRHQETRRLIVPTTATLDSNGVFVVRSADDNEDTIYVWQGSKADDSTAAVAVRLAKHMRGIVTRADNVVVTKEGSEPEAFFEIVSREGDIDASMSGDSSHDVAVAPTTYDDLFCALVQGIKAVQSAPAPSSGTRTQGQTQSQGTGAGGSRLDAAIVSTSAVPAKDASAVPSPASLSGKTPSGSGKIPALNLNLAAAGVGGNIGGTANGDGSNPPLTRRSSKLEGADALPTRRSSKLDVEAGRGRESEAEGNRKNEKASSSKLSLALDMSKLGSVGSSGAGAGAGAVGSGVDVTEPPLTRRSSKLDSAQGNGHEGARSGKAAASKMALTLDMTKVGAGTGSGGGGRGGGAGNAVVEDGAQASSSAASKESGKSSGKSGGNGERDKKGSGKNLVALGLGLNLGGVSRRSEGQGAGTGAGTGAGGSSIDASACSSMEAPATRRQGVKGGGRADAAASGKSAVPGGVEGLGGGTGRRRKSSKLEMALDLSLLQAAGGGGAGAGAGSAGPGSTLQPGDADDKGKVKKGARLAAATSTKGGKGKFPIVSEGGGSRGIESNGDVSNGAEQLNERGLDPLNPALNQAAKRNLGNELDHVAGSIEGVDEVSGARAGARDGSGAEVRQGALAQLGRQDDDSDDEVEVAITRRRLSRPTVGLDLGSTSLSTTTQSQEQERGQRQGQGMLPVVQMDAGATRSPEDTRTLTKVFSAPRTISRSPSGASAQGQDTSGGGGDAVQLSRPSKADDARPTSAAREPERADKQQSSGGGGGGGGGGRSKVLGLSLAIPGTPVVGPATDNSAPMTSSSMSSHTKQGGDGLQLPLTHLDTGSVSASVSRSSSAQVLDDAANALRSPLGLSPIKLQHNLSTSSINSMRSSGSKPSLDVTPAQALVAATADVAHPVDVGLIRGPTPVEDMTPVKDKEGKGSGSAQASAGCTGEAGVVEGMATARGCRRDNDEAPSTGSAHAARSGPGSGPGGGTAAKRASSKPLLFQAVDCGGKSRPNSLMLEWEAMGVYDDDDLSEGSLLLLLCPKMPHFLWVGGDFHLKAGVSVGGQKTTSGSASGLADATLRHCAALVERGDVKEENGIDLITMLKDEKYLIVERSGEESDKFWAFFSEGF